MGFCYKNPTDLAVERVRLAALEAPIEIGRQAMKTHARAGLCQTNAKQVEFVI